MKSKILTKINVLLGVLAMFFAGCHTQGKSVRGRGVEAKYGVPQELLDQWEKERQQQQRNDSTATDIQAPAAEQEVDETPAPDRQPRKYGPMPPKGE